jgi:hypothetical protein
MNNYWSGKTLGEKPLTEILASGFGYIKNKELRSLAYESIYNLWPTSTILLASSICAFAIHNIEDICLVRPTLLLNTDDCLKGCYIINMNEFNDRQNEVVNAVETCKKSGEFPSIVRPENPDLIFNLPDMRPYEFEFSKTDVNDLFTSVHLGI